MDQINETKPAEKTAINDTCKNERKIRHNRRAPNNNDLWIHVDAQSSDSTKFMSLITGISTLAAISLVAVALIQHNQTMVLTKQNEALIAKYEQAMNQMNTANTKALEDIENGLNAVVGSIDRLTIAMSQPTSQTPGETPPEVSVTPEEEAAFFGVLVMNDGTAITPLGLRIAGIYAYSPAANAGMRAGDIIMAIDGTPIDTFDTMSNIILAKKPGDSMTVRYARTQDNTVFFETVEVTLDNAANYDTDLTEPTPEPEQ